MKLLTWWLMLLMSLAGVETVRENRAPVPDAAQDIPQVGKFRAMEDTNGLPPPRP